MESWHTSSVEARESALFSRQNVVHGALLELLCCTWCSSRLGMVFSGNLWSCLKEFKPLVIFDVECGIILEPMQGNWASSRIDLWYTELFHIAVVTSRSL